MNTGIYPIHAHVRDIIEQAKPGDERADLIVHALAEFGRKAEQACIDCRCAFTRRRRIACFLLIFPRSDLTAQNCAFKGSSFFVAAVCRACAADGIEAVMARALTPTRGKA